MKILHTGDWHIGRSFSGFPPEVRRELQRLRFDGVERILSYAREKEIRYVLSAGDQIDSADRRSQELLQKLYALLRRYPEVELVALGGNHDPLGPASLYDRIDETLVPPNFHLVRGAERMELDGAVLFAASLDAKAGRENPLFSLFETSEAATGIRIGLAHGSLMLPGKYKEDDFPLPVETASTYGFDYLALGHWHSTYVHDERTAYPGTHEPMGFDDKGGLLLVDIPAAGQLPGIEEIELPPLCRWREETWEIEVGGSLERVETLLEVPEAGPEMLRLRLRGSVSPAEHERLMQIVEQARHHYLYLELINELDLLPEEADFAELEDFGYISEIARELAAGETVPVGPESGSLRDDISAEDIRNRALSLLFRLAKEEGA